MRLTVLIVGLLLGLVMFLQAFVVNILGDVANDEATEEAAAAGVLVALFWLLACGLVIPVPMASTWLFVISGLIAFLIGGTSEYKDMWLWGGVSLFLALLSFFGWRGKRNERREKLAAAQLQQQRDARMEALLERQQANERLQPSQQPESGIPVNCPSCGHPNAPGTKFCAECGGPLASAQGVS